MNLLQLLILQLQFPCLHAEIGCRRCNLELHELIWVVEEKPENVTSCEQTQQQALVGGLIFWSLAVFGSHSSLDEWLLQIKVTDMTWLTVKACTHTHRFCCYTYRHTENKVKLTHGLLSISTGLWERTAVDLPLSWTQAGVRRGLLWRRWAVKAVRCSRVQTCF